MEKAFIRIPGKADSFAGDVSQDAAREYTVPAKLALNQWALAGNWTVKGRPVVLNAADGKELWRVARDGVSNHSWSTPGIGAAGPGGADKQVVTNGWPYIVSYDLATGRERWRIKSMGDIPVPTPIFDGGLIYVTNAHGGPTPLYAIKPDSSGDLTPADAKSPSCV